MGVLLNNAKLQRIDLPGAATAGGDVTYANGPAIDVGCFLDDVSSSQRFTLGIVASDASAVLYVEAAELAAVAGDRQAAAADGAAGGRGRAAVRGDGGGGVSGDLCQAAGAGGSDAL
jgi:hypothetical protein